VAPAPVLVLLDDGAAGPADEIAQRTLQQTAETTGVRVHQVQVDDGPEVARFASLLAIGRFAAIYLALGQEAS
jgi:hypothetical protein